MIDKIQKCSSEGITTIFKMLKNKEIFKDEGTGAKDESLE